MVEQLKASSVELKAKRTAQRHSEDLKHMAVALGFIIDLCAPDHSKRQLEKLFDNRASYGVIRSWKDGRRHIPEWARTIIRSKLAQALEFESTIKPGPGQSAGWRNVSGYTANR